uniref:Retrotransposon gag domain-containing protein n=1 Tax=Cajanus cajan TaxID=3821 RepID=A0A151QX27_CAJCA|nr:hypothetical protein KK1_044085 [Cajanus cajan]
MDAEVIPWFQMMEKNNLFQSWVGFIRVLELEFGLSPYEGLRYAIFKLTQLGSIHDHYREFIALANRVYGFTPNALLDCFIGGLQPNICKDIITIEPTSMMCVISLAKLYEEKYDPKQKYSPS